MFREIAAFEIRYHLRHPLIWLVSILFFALTFGAITTDSVSIGGSIGNVNRNAPFVIMQILLVMSMIAVFATTAFLANAVLRDDEHRTNELFFTTPVSKFDYVMGRFTGAFVITLVLFVPIMLAILVGSWMPWLDPERIGPTMWSVYAYSFVAIVFPNMFLMGATFFGLATITKSIKFTYAGVVGYFVLYTVVGNLMADMENERLAALFDPMGFGAFSPRRATGPPRTETRCWPGSTACSWRTGCCGWPWVWWSCSSPIDSSRLRWGARGPSVRSRLPRRPSGRPPDPTLRRSRSPARHRSRS